MSVTISEYTAPASNTQYVPLDNSYLGQPLEDDWRVWVPKGYEFAIIDKFYAEPDTHKGDRGHWITVSNGRSLIPNVTQAAIDSRDILRPTDDPPPSSVTKRPQTRPARPKEIDFFFGKSWSSGVR
jgi:hypothetical protein